MSLASKYRFYLSGTYGTDYLANPTEVSKVKETFSKEKEARLGYKRDLSGELVFIGADFEWLYLLETSLFRCENVDLRIQKKCGGVWSDWFIGNLPLTAGKWDIDACTVALEIETVDKYYCLEKDGATEYNAFELTAERKTVTPSPGTLEYATCDIVSDCPVTGDSWTFYRRDYTYDIGDTLSGTDSYARYNLGGGLYAPAILYDYYEYEYSPIAGSYGYSILGQEVTEIDNGVPFSDLIQGLIATICPSLTVRSDFFQINPENISTDNYVTEEASKVLNLVFFQKSDVKRPDASGNATLAMISFNKLMEFLFVCFQVKYHVTDDNYFVLEHVSYITSAEGIDFTNSIYNKYTFHKRKYSYVREDMPKYERFRLMEAFNPDFKGLPIEYGGNCVISIGAGNEKVYASDKFTTDFLFIVDNPDSRDSLVSDDGFCVVACDSSDAILTEAGILGDAKINNTLAFAQLHRDYWQHNRVLLVGKMNGVETNFISSIRTRKQVRITVPHCCDDGFDPSELHKTAFGWGEVERSEYNLISETLELDLLHDVATDFFIVCPTVSATPTTTTVGYAFAPLDVATDYQVKLYKEGVLVDTQLHAAPWVGSVTGTFTGLDINAAYEIEVTVLESELSYSRTCARQNVSTSDLTCPSVELEPRVTSVDVAVTGISAGANEVTLKLYSGVTEIDTFTDTTPVADPLTWAPSGLTASTSYTVRVFTTIGSYVKECGPYSTTTLTPYSFSIILSTMAPECGGLPGDYYSDDSVLVTGSRIYTDVDLTSLAVGFNYAIIGGTVYNIADGILGTPTGDSC